jgi:hypothetical protein
MGVPKLAPAPPLPDALTTRHASDPNDDIQPATKPRSHHAALQEQATVAKRAGRSPTLASGTHAGC